MDETWIGVFFQVIISILIFGLGVPSLILQVFVNDDLRSVIQKHKIGFSSNISLMFISAIFVILLIWSFHPVDLHFEGRNLQIFTQYSTWIKNNSDWLTNFFLSIAILLLPIYWLFQIDYRLENVIRVLVIQDLEKIEFSGEPSQEILESLKLLGETSKSESDRLHVYKAFFDIASGVQNHPNYKGNKLEPLLSLLESCISFKSELSILKALDLCQHLLNQLRIKNLTSSSDTRFILNLVQRLANSSSNNKRELTAKKALDVISRQKFVNSEINYKVIHILLDIGIDALDRHRELMALTVLSEMEFIIATHDDETVYFHYIALAAFFWVEGESRRRLILEHFYKYNFSKAETLEMIEKAKEYFYHQAKFNIVDQLIHFSGELNRVNF